MGIQMKKKLGSILLACLISMHCFSMASCGQQAAEYMVVFHSMCDETVAPVVTTDSLLEVSDLPSPQREGYDFLGWYLDEEYTTKFFMYEFTTSYVELYAKWVKKASAADDKTVTVVANLPQAVTFENDQLLTQIINESNPDYQEVKFTTKLGYKYLYYEIDGVRYAQESVDFDTVTEDKTVTLVCDYATDELPIINIDTAGAAITSKENYVDMTFDMGNCDNVLEEVTGGIRLRGNSTLNFPKKAYRIKFDKKQSLFGLTKAKSWVLLAEYIDPSAMHNMAAFSLAKALDGLDFTPTPHKVNVYLNGSYQGLYTLCEQVQENEGRMDIEVDIDASATAIEDYNFFVCMDKSVVDDPTSVEGETYFYLEEFDRYIELKYPEKDSFESEVQFESFFSQLQTYMSTLMKAFTDKDYEEICRLADVDSLIDFWLVDEIMGEQDHLWKSFNMYHVAEKNGGDGKVHFGPIWDYDWSLFTSYTGVPNVDYEVRNQLHYSNLFYKAIKDIPALQAAAEARYFDKLSGKLDDLANALESQAYSMRESLALNAKKWYASFDEDLTKNNVIFLAESLRARKDYLDLLWS